MREAIQEAIENLSSTFGMLSGELGKIASVTAGGLEDVAGAIRGLMRTIDAVAEAALEGEAHLPQHMDGENIRRRYRVTQLMPAAPGTYAIFFSDEAPEREPVPAWGIWEAWDEDRAGTRVSRIRKEAGPLVLVCGYLEPAAERPDFQGVRVGDWVEHDGAHYDDGRPWDEPECVRRDCFLVNAKEAK
jgi:hypothetical protein